MGHRELPSRDQLRDYNYAVAGHAGTMCDADGELFIKPCTQSEIDFYQSAMRRHPEFAELMPLYMGSLMLSDPADVVNDAVAGVISDAGSVQTAREHIAAAVASQVSTESKSEDNIAWISTKGKKIKTEKAVVLENATYGFKKANILDAKLGVRLWADDAPLEKKRRFDKITSETTHDELGFRIAGMRVYRGSHNATRLDTEGYQVYDKDYGRVTVNEANVVDEFRNFIFSEEAGIDQDTGKAVCAAFARDLARLRDVMMRHESRMYSTSLLFVFEGDGEALRAAIEKNNAVVKCAGGRGLPGRMAKRIDSGVDLGESDADECLAELEASLPQIYTLKLIDFAHAQWTPGQGPDENILKGVRSLERIFQQMAQ